MAGQRVVVEIITDQIHTKDSFHEPCGNPDALNLGLEVIGACKLFAEFIKKHKI